MLQKHYNYNHDFLHHRRSAAGEVLREVVFGMEDGMVSTLGSLTGIAIGSGNHFTVILAGIVIVAVESVSMGIGSYLSSNSQEELKKRKIWEETSEIQNNPQEEKQELYEIYLQDGWPRDLAQKMAEAASQNHHIMLKEMATKELKIFPHQKSSALKGGFYMFVAYVLGGIIPLFAYFALPVKSAVPLSVMFTLTGLFVLGVITAKFIKQPLFKSGLRMLIVGGIALIVGLAAGILIRQF